jgi:alginate biosynthesis protein AlgX
MTLHSLLFAGLAATALSPGFVSAQTASAFGCSEYEFSTTMPALEGEDGVFFRTFADLRLQHPMDNAVMAELGRLSAALKERGTTLIYVTIPAKSQGMPWALPDRAKLYGFDQDGATAVYDDIIHRMTAAGVVAPDIMRAIRNSRNSTETPFFAADFHWSAVGARAAAKAIGDAIKSDPNYASLAPKTYTSNEAGTKGAFSGMRRALQGFCLDPIPPVEGMTYDTVLAEASGDTAASDAAALDIFAAGGEDVPEVVLVGTSFSDSDVNNFAGFISEFSGLEVTNYAVTGGNQFGAMTSYLTSREFSDAPPRFLIWENPIYNNLAQYGSLPMEELIAAAGSSCQQPLSTTRLDDHTIRADFAGLKLGQKDSLAIDYGSEGPRKITFALDAANGVSRTGILERGDRLRATGRFYLSLGPFWTPGLQAITVTFDRPVTDATTLSFCLQDQGDAT